MYAYGDSPKTISGAWKVLYALSFVGTAFFLILNIYFANQYASEKLECYNSSLSRHDYGSSYSGYSSYSSYSMCDYAGRSSQTLASLMSGCVWIAILFMFIWAASWLGSAIGALPTYARKTSPVLAGFSLFIPLFNLYAMFAVPIELCRGIEQVGIRQQSPARAPMVLAIIAGVCTLIPPLWAIAAILWIVFMAITDSAMKKLATGAPQFPPQGIVQAPAYGAYAPQVQPQAPSAYGATALAPPGNEYGAPQPGATVFVRDASGQEIVARVVAQAPGHVQVTFMNGSTTWVAEGNVRWS